MMDMRADLLLAILGGIALLASGVFGVIAVWFPHRARLRFIHEDLAARCFWSAVMLWLLALALWLGEKRL